FALFFMYIFIYNNMLDGINASSDTANNKIYNPSQNIKESMLQVPVQNIKESTLQAPQPVQNVKEQIPPVQNININVMNQTNHNEFGINNYKKFRNDFEKVNRNK